MIAVFLMAVQAPPPPAKAYRSPALQFSCEMIDPQFNRSSIEGSFDPVSGYDRARAIISSDSADVLKGEGTVGMLSPGQNGTGHFSVVIKEGPGVYHDLTFELNGEQRKGSLSIHMRSLDGGRGYAVSATRVGFCSISVNSEAMQQ